MALMTSDAKLFGLDMRVLTAELSDACRKLLQLPLLRRMLPATWVRVVGVDASVPVGVWAQGSRIDWTGVAGEVREKTPYTAVLLDPEQVLQRVLMLPPMAAAAMRGAVEIDVQTMTPFAQHDTLWAYAVRSAMPQGRQRVEVVIASRSQVEQFVRQQSTRLPAGSSPEVWAPSGVAPIVFPGFGEPLRLHSEARRRSWIFLGLGLVVVLAAALAATPTLQLGQRALDASQQFQQLSQASKEVMGKRQVLVDEAQELTKLQERLKQQLDHLRVLAVLTEALPDDAAAQRVQLKGTKLTVQGLTGNASNMAAMLARTPGFLEVRLPTAVTRVPGSNKENFVLEANIDPQVLGLFARDEEAPSEDADADAKVDADAEAGAKTDGKADAKTDAKTDVKAEAKADARTDAKADAGLKAKERQ